MMLVWLCIVDCIYEKSLKTRIIEKNAHTQGWNNLAIIYVRCGNLNKESFLRPNLLTSDGFEL